MSTPNKQPRTAAQAAASRANGAKSHGPTSPEGKSTVSGTRMVHGFRSNCITLSTEDYTAYDAHLDAYLTRYAPVDKVEEDLVGLLASQMWQLMRNNSIEVALFEIEISGVAFNIEGKFEDMDQYGILAFAFKKSAGDNALELLRRYKATSERAYHRALQALETIQKDRKSQQPPAPASPPAEIFPTDQPGEVSAPMTPPTLPLLLPDAEASKPRLLVMPNRPQAANSELATEASTPELATETKIYDFAIKS